MILGKATPGVPRDPASERSKSNPSRHWSLHLAAMAAIFLRSSGTLSFFLLSASPPKSPSVMSRPPPIFPAVNRFFRFLLLSTGHGAPREIEHGSGTSHSSSVLGVHPAHSFRIMTCSSSCPSQPLDSIPTQATSFRIPRATSQVPRIHDAVNLHPGSSPTPHLPRVTVPVGVTARPQTCHHAIKVSEQLRPTEFLSYVPRHSSLALNSIETIPIQVVVQQAPA